MKRNRSPLPHAAPASDLWREDTPTRVPCPACKDGMNRREVGTEYSAKACSLCAGTRFVPPGLAVFWQLNRTGHLPTES
jgi:hypothetical protein